MSKTGHLWHVFHKTIESSSIPVTARYRYTVINTELNTSTHIPSNNHCNIVKT
jgi:hypothetical protein